MKSRREILKAIMMIRAGKRSGNGDSRYYPRHFLDTAKKIGFDVVQMEKIISKIKANCEQLINETRVKLADNFSEKISESLFSGMLKQLKKL